MDTEFDGFMKTLDNLNDNIHIAPNDKTTSSFDVDIEDLLASDGSSYFKNKNETQASIATTVRIENEVNIIGDAMKSVDSNHTTEFASMHSQFMQSIKEIKDLNLSNDTNQHNNNDIIINTPKLSELNQRSSIDSRVDAELKELLETGTCKQQEPEQNDTVELSISDADHQSECESEIILENIDDLESIKSATESVIASPSNMNNTKPNAKTTESTMNEIESEVDYDSNEAEYDLESFGIKEAKPEKVMEDKETNRTSLRASLPSVSSFENERKAQQITNASSNASSNTSSIAATPHLTKLKKKMKQRGTTNSTPFKTPITMKSKVIQTPRHSLKHSIKSIAPSPFKRFNIEKLEEQLNILQRKLHDKDKMIRDLKDEFKEQKKQIEADANAKIKNTESTLFALECKLKEMQNGRCIGDTESDEINILKKEIESMERIIDGLNEENAKLIEELKQQKLDLQQSQQIMYNENKKINDNLKTTQQQLTQIHENKTQELHPAAFNEIQRLRKELKETKDTSMCRSRELGIEMNKLKQQNRSLQFKLDGIDDIRFDNESNVLQQFKKEALKIQKKSQDQIHELERKLKWYIENQELIQNLNQQIKEKNKEIISLKSSQSNSPILIHKKVKMKATHKEHRQIVMLKKKVHDLEKLLSSKHPDSIANLISMMNTHNNDNDESDNIMIKQLKEQIVMLKETSDNKEDEVLSRLRGLKQQNDKVLLTLNNKIKSLQKQLTTSKRQKGFIKPSTKIKELEQQIADLKQSHNKKIKMLKDKHLTQMRKEQQKEYGSTNNEDVMTLQNDLEYKMNDIETLNKKLNQKESMIKNLQMIVDTEKRCHNDLKTQIYLLQTQLKNAIKQHETKEIKTICIDDDEKEKEKMYIEKIKIMECEINEYKRQCAILTDKVDLERNKGEQSVKAIQNELEWNKLEKEKTQQLIVKLQFELNHAKNTPSYIEYETLLRKLEKIEKRGSDRERELEQTYMKLLQSNDDIEQELTKKYEAVIANKDDKLRSLQNELSVLMTAFDKIQKSS